MEKIGIVGSGRWAKVTLKILNNIFSKNIRFIIFSNNGINQIKNWILEENFNNNFIEVYSYNQMSKKLCDSYIVINAPKNHFKISKKIISLGKPLIIEKPISLSKSDVKFLIDLSNKNKVILGTSNIFLFTDYIFNFKKLIASYKNISSIEFIWSDPKSESRYGELKTYDPSIALHKDVLPHILSIVFYLFDTNNVSVKEICFLRGGSHLKLEFNLDGKKLHIQIKRNSQKRNRIIKIFDRDLIKLDFSTEPVKVEINSREKIIESQCNKFESPATKMYRIFFNTLTKSNSMLDSRIRPILKIYSLIDDVDSLYVDQQEKYIRKIILDQSSELDFNYCIKEFFLEKSLASYNNVDAKVDNFIELIKKKSFKNKNFLNKELSAFVENSIN